MVEQRCVSSASTLTSLHIVIPLKRSCGPPRAEGSRAGGVSPLPSSLRVTTDGYSSLRPNDVHCVMDDGINPSRRAAMKDGPGKRVVPRSPVASATTSRNPHRVQPTSPPHTRTGSATLSTARLPRLIQEPYHKNLCLSKVSPWCRLNVYEHTDHVASFLINQDAFCVDGSVGHKQPLRIGFASLPTRTRDPKVHKVRKCIGKGLQLHLDEQHNLWVTRLGKNQIFTKGTCLCPELLTLKGRLTQAVPMKVFDLAAFQMLLDTKLSSGSITEDNLVAHCKVCLSFVKQGQSDKDTPCWIELWLLDRIKDAEFALSTKQGREKRSSTHRSRGDSFNQPAQPVAPPQDAAAAASSASGGASTRSSDSARSSGSGPASSSAEKPLLDRSESFGSSEGVAREKDPQEDSVRLSGSLSTDGHHPDGVNLLVVASSAPSVVNPAPVELRPVGSAELDRPGALEVAVLPLTPIKKDVNLRAFEKFTAQRSKTEFIQRKRADTSTPQNSVMTKIKSVLTKEPTFATARVPRARPQDLFNSALTVAPKSHQPLASSAAASKAPVPSQRTSTAKPALTKQDSQKSAASSKSEKPALVEGLSYRQVFCPTGGAYPMDYVYTPSNLVTSGRRYSDPDLGSLVDLLPTDGRWPLPLQAQLELASQQPEKKWWRQISLFPKAHK